MTFVTLIGVPLPPAFACVNQTSLPPAEKLEPLIVRLMPARPIESIEGLEAEAVP